MLRDFNMDNKIVHLKTGELVDIKTASPDLVSEVLSEILIKIKQLKKYESAVKSHIKSQELTFDKNKNGTEVAEYGMAKIRKTHRSSFDKKTFEEKATDEEKSLYKKWLEIESKYQKLTETLTIY